MEVPDCAALKRIATAASEKCFGFYSDNNTMHILWKNLRASNAEE